MGYLNNVAGYRKDLLANRMIIKHGNFALLTPDSLVKNIILGPENCDAIILSMLKLGASFVDHLVMLHQNGGNQQGLGGKGVETFLYVISGNIITKAEGKTFTLSEGSHLYCPPDFLMTFVDAQAEDGQIFLYEHYYIPVEGYVSWLVSGSTSELERIHYEGMDNVILLDLLPEELGFDMSMHIPSFAPGTSHGCTGTHAQEYGAYILSDQGAYNLGNNWIPVKKGDYTFIGTYSLQAGYDAGRDEASSYTYPKDCNRDVEI